MRAARAFGGGGPVGGGAAEDGREALARQIAAVDSARALEAQQGAGRGKGRAAKRKSSPKGRSVRTPAGTAVQRAEGRLAPEVYYLAPSPPSSPTSPSPVAGPARIDLDVASAAEIERLPRIGPVLARRIVADRDSAGPFGSLEELRRVKGIGAALAKAIAPYVTFSLSPRPSRVDDRSVRERAGRVPRRRRPQSP